MSRAEEVRRQLDRRIGLLGRVAVAFSGGVDSTALLHACRRVLGREKVLAVTADSPSFPRHEMMEALELGRRIDVEHLVVATRELDDPSYRRNDGDRCYFCKKELFSVMDRVAREKAVDSLAYGAIADDLLDFRPGARAAGEFRVAAPLQEAGWTKEDVRRYSRAHGLPTAEKAPFACLSSRIPRGVEVSTEALRQVERAEEVLRTLGYRQFRVRHFGSSAKVEVGPGEVERALGRDRQGIWAGIRAAGYERVFLDTGGYRSGSVSGGPGSGELAATWADLGPGGNGY